MTDSRKRGQERRAGQGDDQAAAQVLRERIRLGECSEAAARVAARLGFQPAALIYTDEPVTADIAAELTRARSYSRDLVSHIAVAIARRLLAHCSSAPVLVEHDAADDGVHAVDISPYANDAEIIGAFVAHPSVSSAGRLADVVVILDDDLLDLPSHEIKQVVALRLSAGYTARCWLSLTEAPPQSPIATAMSEMVKRFGDFLARSDGRVDNKRGREQAMAFVLAAAVEHLFPERGRV